MRNQTGQAAEMKTQAKQGIVAECWTCTVCGVPLDGDVDSTAARWAHYDTHRVRPVAGSKFG